MTEIADDDRRLGTAIEGDVTVDLDALIGSHAAIVANSGGGKSGAVRRLLETTQGRVQQIILDPEDEFYTLRETGEYVIAGGDDPDMPISIAGARNLAIGALTHGFSLIVQLNDLGASSPEYVAEFLNGLMNAPRSLWHPALIVIDEAQRFAPSGAATAASDAVRDLVNRGRKRGFTAVLASLRISSIDPAVRGLVNNWMLGRTGQSLDKRTMAEQLGFTAREAREALKLVPRQFWAFGPALAPDPVLVRISDVHTTAVRPGQAKIPMPPPAEALRDILQGLLPPAPAAPDGKIPLMKPGTEIAVDSVESALLAQLRQENKDMAADVVYMNTMILDERHAFRHALTWVRDEFSGVISLINNRLEALPGGDAVDTEIPPAAPPRSDEGDAVQVSPVTASVPVLPKEAPPQRQGGNHLDWHNETVAGDIQMIASGRPRAVLEILCSATRPTGDVTISEKQWAFRAGVDRKSSTWRGYKAKLRGLFEQKGDRVFATIEGQSAFLSLPPPLTGHGLVHKWIRDLATGPGNALRFLLNCYPQGMSREHLADALGTEVSKSTFRGYLAPLSTLELIERDGENIKLSSELMAD